MSHKVLAERYAQQLHDAHKRILELENVVADREYDLEQAKVGGLPPKQEDEVEIGHLRNELAAKDEAIDQLESQIHKDRLAFKTTKDNKTTDLKIQLEIVTQRAQQLKEAEKAHDEDLRKLQAEDRAVRERAKADVQEARDHVRDIEAWAKSEVDKMLAQKQQAVQQLAAARSAHEAQAGPSAERIRFLEKALENSNRLALAQSAESLRVENEHLVKCIRESAEEKFELKKRVTRLTREVKGAVAVDARVKELQVRLGQERKRTYVLSVSVAGESGC